MKVKNKKTGEIVELIEIVRIDDVSNEFYLRLSDKEGRTFKVGINSLAELNEEWEDYEESKDFWFIDPEILIACESTNPLLCDKKVAIETMKQIGNYFETREEAEKAVEKLKAVKRLKDKGFRFKMWEWEYIYDDNISGELIIKAHIDDATDSDGKYTKDLDICFGDEE